MKMKTMKTLVILGLVFSNCLIKAQVAVVAAGGDASGSGGKVSFTVGQVAYTLGTGSGGDVNQGVQQPFEISVITDINDTKEINLECKVYPNPADDFLLLQIDLPSERLSKLEYGIYSIEGQQLTLKKVDGSTITISLQDQVPGIYILRVFEENKELKTFKIIKN
jgi:hypothetical protein